MVPERATGILFRESKRGVGFDENCGRRQIEASINRTVIRAEDRKRRYVYFGVRRDTLSDVVRRKGLGIILRSGKEKEGKKVMTPGVEDQQGGSFLDEFLKIHGSFRNPITFFSP